MPASKVKFALSESVVPKLIALELPDIVTVDEPRESDVVPVP